MLKSKRSLVLNNIFDGTIIKVLDIETTGLNIQIDRIIELGVVEYVNGEYVLEHSRLFGGGSSSFDLIKIHGIKDSQREGLKTFEECSERICEYLSNCILVGHNIKRFDIPFIDEKLKLSDRKLQNIKIIDTLLLSRKYKISSSNNKLGSLCSQLGIEYGNHRGLADSKCTWILLNKIIELQKIENLRDLFA